MKKYFAGKEISVVTLFFLLCSCSNTATSIPVNETSVALSALSWLQGSWVNKKGESESHEIWTKTNDSVYSGKSFAVKNGDTVFMEYLSLEAHDTDLYYIPTVTNQNGGKPVSFKLVSSANGIFIFENKTHDFPQRIVYANPAPDSVFAYIEGTKNGKYGKVSFPMKRESK